MSKIFRTLILLTLTVVILFCVRPVQAAGEFKADYDVQYNVAPSGTTIVTQNITLTNQETNLYAKQYSITIDGNGINNIIAYDAGGVINPEVSLANNETKILLSFNKEVVGLGKKQTFQLRYESSEVARKNGSVWEINIPGIAPDPDIDSYFVSLDVPAIFGLNAYLTPLPASGRRWNKEQMATGGISAAYGTEQTYNLDLTYTLFNSNLNSVIQQISIPPDTAYQKISINKMDPQPLSIAKDEDGNWLASYKLTTQQQLTINAQLSASLFFKPRPDYPATTINVADYTKNQKFWESNNPEIIKLAKIYKTPRDIYNYVVNKLNYDYSKVETVPIRKGAVGALNSPNTSVCAEFTDLFIAIARAAGIPARQATGYAHTTNSKLRPLSLVTDVLHAWPEYYDFEAKIWVPIDPTWARTTGGINYFDKMDFNHIVFAYQGVNSELPLPVGFYRTADKISKDIIVSFATKSTTEQQGTLHLQLNTPAKAFTGTKINGDLTIENLSNQSYPDVEIEIQGEPLNFQLVKKETNLPPFGKLIVPISLVIPNLSLVTNARILATVNGKSIQQIINIWPIYYLGVPVILAVFVIIIGISWLIIRKKHEKSKK